MQVERLVQNVLQAGERCWLYKAPFPSAFEVEVADYFFASLRVSDIYHVDIDAKDYSYLLDVPPSGEINFFLSFRADCTVVAASALWS